METIQEGVESDQTNGVHTFSLVRKVVLVDLKQKHLHDGKEYAE